MTSTKYIGMDVHTEHAESPIMPTVAGEALWEGLARLLESA